MKVTKPKHQDQRKDAIRYYTTTKRCCLNFRASFLFVRTCTHGYYTTQHVSGTFITFKSIGKTPSANGERPCIFGETPSVLKKAFVVLCLRLVGGIPRCGGGKNVATAANWAQKRVTCRVQSLSAAFARAIRAAKSKAQSSAGAFPCGNGTVSFSVFIFLPSLFSRPRQWLNIQPLAEVPDFSSSSAAEHSTARPNVAGSLRTPAERGSF